MSKFEQYLIEAQKYKSADTSINKKKLPATFTELVKKGVIQPGMIVADLGGGKFDNAIEWAKEHGASLHVIDPYNRSMEYNKKSLEEVKGKADLVTVNNVLNVIAEPEQRAKVVQRAYRLLKQGGKLYIKIYEGSKSGEGMETQGGKSWQNNRVTKEYMEEVLKIFPNAKTKGEFIIATKE